MNRIPTFRWHYFEAWNLLALEKEKKEIDNVNSPKLQELDESEEEFDSDDSDNGFDFYPTDSNDKDKPPSQLRPSGNNRFGQRKQTISYDFAVDGERINFAKSYFCLRYVGNFGYCSGKYFAKPNAGGFPSVDMRVTHKLLLRGHTHMKEVHVHGLTEKTVKKQPTMKVVTPWDWEQLVKAYETTVYKMDFRNFDVLYTQQESPFTFYAFRCFKNVESRLGRRKEETGENRCQGKPFYLAFSKNVFT
ncbi:hypothetical protein ILUMI_09527 [Ignelater luminosus]|uniref:Uncharacterized protein n=1 Tax=Ignelater luminosus TaxID=2038154 RepID=A0A8K0D5M1_IGNLU|nr:hypothetical protein ILUMI_09527 [Ignelater luminosus]